jgi:hypothetical protein
MISVTEKVIPQSEIPNIVKIHQRKERKISNGNFISSIYATTDEGLKWVSVQKNGCPNTIKVRSNYLAQFDSVGGTAEYIEARFVENISKGDFGNCKFYKFQRYDKIAK